jgi:hypothetical protein
VYKLTIAASNAASSLTTQAFTLTVDQAPAITSAASATFMVGKPGSFTITTTGYPAAALTEKGTLPAGVTFTAGSNGTATLSGTPSSAAAGVYTITVNAANSISSATPQTFKLTVDRPPIIVTANTASFIIGQAGNFTITAAGYPAATLSESGNLPSGVSFTAGGNGTATLHGTPAAGTGGTYNFTITASNGVLPESFQLFTLVVAAKPATAPGVAMPNAATNDAALVAVLADSSGGATDMGSKKGLSVSDLWLFDEA